MKAKMFSKNFFKVLGTVFGILVLFSICACGKKDLKNLAGEKYVYDKEGFGTDFVIQFFEDNKFHYYEGALSSYIGLGTWEYKDGVVTLSDKDPHFKNRFRVKDDKLVWIEEGSTNFLYVKVKDGDTFSIPGDDYDPTNNIILMP